MCTHPVSQDLCLFTSLWITQTLVVSYLCMYVVNLDHQSEQKEGRITEFLSILCQLIHITDIKDQIEVPCDQDDCVQASGCEDCDHKPFCAPRQSVNSSDNVNIHATVTDDPEGEIHDIMLCAMV